MYRCVFTHNEIEYDNLLFSSAEKAMDFAYEQLEENAVILNENDTIVYVMINFECFTIH